MKLDNNKIDFSAYELVERFVKKGQMTMNGT